eukprot:1158782-Pelagomonas_calceolata.AAC.3
MEVPRDMVPGQPHKKHSANEVQTQCQHSTNKVPQDKNKANTMPTQYQHSHEGHTMPTQCHKTVPTQCHKTNTVPIQCHKDTVP